MQEIKLVCFDLGGVLVQLNPNFKQRLLGIASPEEASALQGLLRDDFIHDQDHFSQAERYQLGEIGSEEFFQLLSDALKGKLSSAEIREAINSQIAGENSASVKLLSALQGRVRLGCFSNTNASHWQVMQEKFAWMSLFELPLASHLVRAAKPHPSAYRRICEVAKLSPRECVFIDDRQVNVEAALICGMQAHLFRSAKELQDFLIGQGLLAPSLLEKI